MTKHGFTLAEVLVTLGIIGVVSAMTLPTLVKNHQRTVFTTQLHKVVNEISQAVERVISDSNAVNIKESNIRKTGFDGFMRNYFKTTKICTGASTKDCFAESYTNLNGENIRIRSFIVSGCDANSENCATTRGTAMITAGGASIYMVFDGSGGNSLYIVTDINGKQEPNILGRDLFDFVIDGNGTISVGNIDDAVSNFTTNCTAATDITVYGACIAKIMDDGWKMDY